MSGETNPMRALCVEKLVINIGVGQSGDPLAKAQKVLKMVTGQKSVLTRAHSTNRDLGIREGQEIGAKVTLRGQRATEFLQKALGTRENQLSRTGIDRDGNVAFGIPDYTDFPGFKYDPAIGIFGMDICIEIGRKGGMSVKRRTRASHAIGKSATLWNRGSEI
ncbi:MAG: 50S ribosomal protein L5 [Candidatus Thermoplasmatota archaeon]|nr:50S ribosomal protein L5 [Candidatus Thermoplasmatota archaeon]